MCVGKQRNGVVVKERAYTYCTACTGATLEKKEDNQSCSGSCAIVLSIAWAAALTFASLLADHDSFESGEQQRHLRRPLH